MPSSSRLVGASVAAGVLLVVAQVCPLGWPARPAGAEPLPRAGCLECRDSGSQPVISSNGTTSGTAIVWALKTPGGSGGSITLYAFDALNMGTTLFTGKAGTWTQAAGTAWIGGALVSPLVANGKVYVPTDGSVAVFGLH